MREKGIRLRRNKQGSKQKIEWIKTKNSKEYTNKQTNKQTNIYRERVLLYCQKRLITYEHFNKNFLLENFL